MPLEGTPVKAQGFKKQPIRVIGGKAHRRDRHCDVQPQVLDKTSGGNKGIQQRRRGQLAVDLVLKAWPGDSIPCQALDQAPGAGVVFQPDDRFGAERLNKCAFDHPFSPHRQLGAVALDLLAFTRVEAQYHPGVHGANIAMAMEGVAVDLQGGTIRFYALDRPRARAKPQVFNAVAEFFIALGSQLGHGGALLYIRVVALQRFELHGLAAHLLDQLGKAPINAHQVAVTQVHLLALGFVEAQVEGVAVGVVSL